VPVEKECSLVADNLLDKGVYTLHNLLIKLQSFTETFDSNSCKFCYLHGAKRCNVISKHFSAPHYIASKALTLLKNTPIPASAHVSPAAAGLGLVGLQLRPKKVQFSISLT
jgi:hypothetical protein